MTLTQLFTSIANAIRNKKGTSSTIIAENFPTEINSIQTGITPTGTINITQNGTTDVTNYATANVNVSSLLPANIHFSTSSLDNFNFLLNSYNTNTTDGKDMFSYCIYITTVPLLDFSKFTTAMNMFKNCSALVEVPPFNLSNVTVTQSMFNGCTNLEEVPEFLVSKKLDSMGNMFTNCSKLSNESLNNILAMCVSSGVSGSSNKKLKSIGLSSAQATTCTSLSNWAAAQSAGWSTGY